MHVLTRVTNIYMKMSINISIWHSNTSSLSLEIKCPSIKIYMYQLHQLHICILIQ